MANFNIPDNFIRDLAKLESEFYDLLKRGMKGFKSEGEFAVFVQSVDFFEELKELGLETKAVKYLDDYNTQIKQILGQARKFGIEAVGQTSIQQLELYRALDYQKILRRAQDFSDDVRKEFIGQVISGNSLDVIRERVLPQIQQTVKFTPAWFNTAMVTSYANYDALALEETFKEEPNARYNLFGPNDDRTRESCKHALKISKANPNGFTIEEINKGALGIDYNFQQRGGFNCRHYWELNFNSIVKTKGSSS